MTFPTYSTGTVSVSDNGTVVTGIGTLWQRSNVRQGDKIVIDPAAGHPELTILAVNDVDQLTLAQPWTYGDKTSVSYIIIKESVERVSGVRAFDDLDAMIAAMNADGFYHFVSSAQTLPDESYGDDGQYAFQASTGKLWVKETTWQFVGIYKGFGLPAPWSSIKAYVPFDVATLNGTSYVAIASNTNQSPPNATYWAVLAAKGDTGNTGPTGPGYGGTSATALTIGTGSRVFTTQTGMAYQVGTRVRAASAAAPSNYMEGIVTAYSGTFLTVNMSRTNGAGTLSDWMLSVAGDPGSGDMLSTNNLSDVANAATARTNLGLGSGNSPQFSTVELGHATDTTLSRPAAGRMQVEGAEALTTANLASVLNATQQAQARANIGVLGKNRIINGRFEIDQRNRGVTTTVADNAYWSDRWRYIGEESASCQASEYGLGDRMRGVVVFPGTTGKGGVFQVIEDINCRDLRGKQVTLSASLLVSNTRLSDMRMAILEWTGTANATTGDPVSSWNAAGTNPTLAAGWAYLNVPVNIGAVAAHLPYSVTATVGNTMNNLAAMIWNDDKSYNASDAFAGTDVQLEPGGVATPYEFKLASQVEDECLRYHYKYTSSGNNSFIGQGGIQAGGAAIISWPLKRPMRATPVVTSTGTLEMYDMAALSAVSGVTTNSDSNLQICREYSLATALTAGREAVFLTRAGSTISHSAEI